LNAKYRQIIQICSPNILVCAAYSKPQQMVVGREV